MLQVFTSAFSSLFLALLSLTVIIVAAGALIRYKIITQAQISALAQITVKVLLPCMIFSTILNSFDPAKYTFWWMLPIAIVIMTFVGLGIVSLLFIRKIKEKKNIFPVASMPNAGYLVLPIGEIVYKDRFDEFAIYVFLIVIGINIILWSIGKKLTTGAETEKASLLQLITPPLVANLLSLTLVLTHTHHYVPKFLNDSVSLLGEATVPIATFVLGGTLGSLSFKSFAPFWDIFRVSVVKFLFIPALTIAILYYLELKQHYPLLTDVFVIESTAPAATAIVLQLRTYGGDWQRIGSIMVVSYIICLFAIPFWMAVWALL